MRDILRGQVDSKAGAVLAHRKLAPRRNDAERPSDAGRLPHLRLYEPDGAVGISRRGIVVDWPVSNTTQASLPVRLLLPPIRFSGFCRRAALSCIPQPRAGQSAPGASRGRHFRHVDSSSVFEDRNRHALVAHT